MLVVGPPRRSEADAVGCGLGRESNLVVMELGRELNLVGQVVGLELWIRWVVVWRLVGFFGLFDGGSSGLGAVSVASLVAPMVVL
nr:hypothetical protein CFP56_18423 [Quercus suber]